MYRNKTQFDMQNHKMSNTFSENFIKIHIDIKIKIIIILYINKAIIFRNNLFVMQNHKTYPMFSDIFLKINIVIKLWKKVQK